MDKHPSKCEGVTSNIYIMHWTKTVQNLVFARKKTQVTT